MSRPTPTSDAPADRTTLHGPPGHHTAPTRADLLHRARRDAEQHLAEHPLPDRPLPTPDLAPYLAALAAAETPAEAHAVTRHLLDAANPALRAVSEYLLAAAQWRDQHRRAAPDSPPKVLYRASAAALTPLVLADLATEQMLQAAYGTPPARQKP
ncbi:hypothetical protein ACFYVL_09310 [Streptomyces sp. NPDC004111]|uniref:hypothetical protein n=1 Tax=Streptomyces sp. NPDC004111 TaxID=3364690 RepID=UPI003699FFC7